MSAPQPMNVAYSLNQPLSTIFPLPIVSKRSPNMNDRAQIGQLWVNVLTNAAFVLTSITNANSIWSDVTGGSGSFTNLVVSGSATIGTTLTVGTGITLTTGNITASSGNISASGSVTGGTGVTATTGNIVASSGNMSASGTITAGTGITSTTGNIVATAGAVNAGTTMTAGTGITATTGNIVATAGAVNAGTTMTAGTGLTVTTGNATISTGDLIINGTGAGVELPGPVLISSGAGSPSAGLATAAGDLYINTTPTGATDRLFVATGAGTWTNVTCAA